MIKFCFLKKEEIFFLVGRFIVEKNLIFFRLFKIL